MSTKKKEIEDAKVDYWYHRKLMEYHAEVIKTLGGRVPKL